MQNPDKPEFCPFCGKEVEKEFVKNEANFSEAYRVNCPHCDRSGAIAMK